MMFGTQGYVETDAGAVEEGFEKIALYINKHGQVTHAARQLQNGFWTSKLGNNCDVMHAVEALEGGLHGLLGKFLKRPKPVAPLPQVVVAPKLEPPEK
jgi:hypothetical protein